MKIAYFDLGFSNESYALNANRYGGAAVVGRHMKQIKDIDFTIIAPQESFDEFSDEDRKERCFPLDKKLLQLIAKGYPVDKIINGLDKYDFIMHMQTCLSINKGSLKLPVVHLSGFSETAGHPNNDYILLYLNSFKPIFGEKAKYIKLGKQVPNEFKEALKEDYIYQVSRHDDHMNSIEVAKFCLENKTKGVFAGPIHGDYQLLKYIDNKYTFYVGTISEKEKMELHSKARLFCLLHKWDVPFNQSVIEANGVGTPILVNDQGPFFKQYVKEGKNGFLYNGTNLMQAYQNSFKVDQKECWLSAREYSIEEMIKSILQALKEIKQEWNYKRT
jgi:glycosyltransferase involved in cell wall biosynthesis